MPTPSGSATVKDSGAIPAPQFWDNAAAAYQYLQGTNFTGELFATPAPITPAKSTGYVASQTVKTSGGIFFGANGCYKGSVAAWIMMFDAAAAPATGAVPFASVPVGPTSGGVDNPWFYQPARPYWLTAGLVIALSTTGGTFTASANTDITITTEYI